MYPRFYMITSENAFKKVPVTKLVSDRSVIYGSLYVHFKNKEKLSYSAVDYSIKMLQDKILAAGVKQKMAKRKLFAVLNALSNPINPLVTGGCSLLNFGMEADDTNPVILEKENKAMENESTNYRCCDRGRR